MKKKLFKYEVTCNAGYDAHGNPIVRKDVVVGTAMWVTNGTLIIYGMDEEDEEGKQKVVALYSKHTWEKCVYIGEHDQ